jgi:hypothetical protein
MEGLQAAEGAMGEEILGKAQNLGSARKGKYNTWEYPSGKEFCSKAASVTL